MYNKDWKDLTDEEIVKLFSVEGLSYEEMKKIYNTSASTIRKRVKSIDGYVHTPKSRRRHVPIDEFIEDAQSDYTIEQLSKKYRIEKGRVKKLLHKHGLTGEVKVTQTYRLQDRIMSKLEESDIALQVLRRELSLSVKDIVKITGVSSKRLRDLCREKGYIKTERMINPLHLFVLYYILEIDKQEIADVLGTSKNKIKSWLHDYQYYNPSIMRDAEKWVKDAYQILRDMGARKRAKFEGGKTTLAEWINQIRREAIKIVKKYPRQ